MKKVVGNGSSYWSIIFYFDEIGKIKQLWNKNLDFDEFLK